MVKNYSESFSEYSPYGWQARFHARGAEFRHRLVLKSNLAGGTVAVAAECSFHRRRSYPEWWRGWRFSLRPVLVPRLLVVAPGEVGDFRHSSLAFHLGRFGLERSDYDLLPGVPDFDVMGSYEVVAMDEFPDADVHADLIGKAVSVPGLSMLVGRALSDAHRLIVSRYRPGERMTAAPEPREHATAPPRPHPGPPSRASRPPGQSRSVRRQTVRYLAAPAAASPAPPLPSKRQPPGRSRPPRAPVPDTGGAS